MESHSTVGGLLYFRVEHAESWEAVKHLQPEVKTRDDPDFKRASHVVYLQPEMNSVLPTKSETGMWCKKVEFELDRFIFVAPKPIPEEQWTKLCEQYGEHQTRVLVGDALLIDLRGKQPTFVSVPADYTPPEVVT
jgi:hypothetical protein